MPITERLTIRIEPELKLKLEDLADEQEVSVGAYLRDIVRDKLEREHNYILIGHSSNPR